MSSINFKEISDNKDILSTLTHDHELNTPQDLLRYHVLNDSALASLTNRQADMLFNKILPSMIEQGTYTITYTSLTPNDSVVRPNNNEILRALVEKGFLIKENAVLIRLNFNNFIPHKQLLKFKNSFAAIKKDTGLSPTKTGAILQNTHKVQVTNNVISLLTESSKEKALVKVDKQLIHYLMTQVDMDNMVIINPSILRKGATTELRPYVKEVKGEIEVLGKYTLNVLNKSLCKLRDLQVFQVISSTEVTKFKKDVHYTLFINPRFIMRSPSRYTAFSYVSDIIFEAQERGDTFIQEGMFGTLLSRAVVAISKIKAERNKVINDYSDKKKKFNKRLQDDNKGINPITQEEYKELFPIYETFSETLERIKTKTDELN